MRNRLFWVVATLVMGLLQSWDSGAFAVGPAVTALTLAGVLLPAAALAREGQAIQLAALVTGAGLLVVARIVSPVSLNALHLALFPAALCAITSGIRRTGMPARS